MFQLQLHVFHKLFWGDINCLASKHYLWSLPGTFNWMQTLA